jgi:hypothetical protein
MPGLVVEPTGENVHGPNQRGHRSRCVWGFVHGPDGAVAAYFVHWTVGHVAEYWPNFDFILGPWGEGAEAAQRRLVALEYRLLETGPAFRVINGSRRPAAAGDLVGRALRRSQVVGRPVAQEAFAVADAVLAQDGRLAELLGPWRVRDSGGWAVLEPPAAPHRGGTKRKKGSSSPRRGR